MERRVFNAINFQRVSQYCDPLQWNEALTRSARDHSRRMAAAHFFGHIDPEWGSLDIRLDRAGIPWSRCAENVFREKDYPDPVAISVVEWMYSPGHRENILTAEFTDTGVGVACDSDGAVFITQQFLLLRRPL